MSDLTEDDKKRIEAEEKYRAEVRDKIQNEKDHPTEEKVPWYKPKGRAAKFFVWGIVILFIFSLIGSLGDGEDSSEVSGTSTSSDTNTETDRDLDGSIRFTGTQFEVTNDESRTWESCRFVLNDDYHYPPQQGIWGTESKVIGTIQAGETVTIGAANFLLKDGTRFNPFQKKPLEFTISCENGFGYFSW